MILHATQTPHHLVPVALSALLALGALYYIGCWLLDAL